MISTWAKEPRVETVTVEDDYVIAPNETQQAARLNAISHAQNKAIADKFGTMISSSTHMTTGQIGEKSADEIFNYNIADVNGEWIETIHEEAVPVYDTKTGLSLYHVKLKGKIREIIQNPIDVKWSVMANGTDPVRNALRANTFLVGDYMYLYFQSPVDGYLAVYLEDSEGDKITQCLLPYRGINEGAMKIEAEKPYIFFSKEEAQPEVRQFVARLKMDSLNDIDYNHLYVIFSPNQFSKVLDEDSTDSKASLLGGQGEKIHLMPRQTTGEKFHKWLAKARVRDKEMQAFHTILQIKR